MNLCKNKPCYLVQCNHCNASGINEFGCIKTEEEQRRVNLFIENSDLVDSINKEVQKCNTIPYPLYIMSMYKILNDKLA